MTGVLPVDKPQGPTSHDVVAAARRALGIRRIGHTGTLDPFATGLLLLCVGQATRLAEYLSGLSKSYVGVAHLGTTTETDDPDGAVTGRSESWRELSREQVELAFARQVGIFAQVPPRFSAKKVGGEALHRKARRGEIVEPAAVQVEVKHLAILRCDLPEVEFEIHCSSGTYVRSVARDVGQTLGCGAFLASLRRTAIGPHEVESALPMSRLSDAAAVRGAWLTPLAALPHLPQVAVADADARRLAVGAATPAPSDAPPDGTVLVATNGDLLAVACVQRGWLQPQKVFHRAG
jgi:tRNA pseudouridine55 synthase